MQVHAKFFVLDGFAPVIRSVTFGCQDPDALAGFWAAATGYRKGAWPEPGDCAVISDLAGQGPVFWFNRVPQLLPPPGSTRGRVCGQQVCQLPPIPIWPVGRLPRPKTGSVRCFRTH